MSSVSPQELEFVKKCIDKVAKGRAVSAACVYGSKVAGYARPDSDIDVLMVLENYPYAVKYVYLGQQGMKVSALAVDRKALERDAKSAFLGEFVIGRLLHVYEPIANAELFAQVERAYKRRVILEEVQDIVGSMGVLSTEIIFPLEFVAFSKIRRRMSLYPGAAYSYQRTYADRRNLELALKGYRLALADIVAEDPELFAAGQDDLLQLSDRRVFVEKGRTRLKLTKRLQEFGSYFVHTYAGRKIMHLAVTEAESKIRRRAGKAVSLPDFMACPKAAYWRLPEGRIITGGRDWIGSLGYSVTSKKRLGNVNSRTVLYVLKDGRGVVVKELARSKAVKWAALSLWTSPVKRFRVDPLLRLGFEYRATRYLRSLGLRTPAIEAVVPDRRLLVTKFVEGETLAGVIKACLKGKGDFGLLRQAGEQIAKIHNAGGALGNVKPKNVIASGNDLYFTDVEQFVFHGGDPAWDLAQFISWSLKGTRNSKAAARVAREFLQGYTAVAGSANIARLAKSRRHVESFYPVLAPAVARAIKKEVKEILE